MWWKIAAGAAAGAAVGAFVPPGYALWIVLGVAAGYLIDAWTRKRGGKAPSGQ